MKKLGNILSSNKDWIQGCLSDYAGHCCLVGAIDKMGTVAGDRVGNIHDMDKCIKLLKVIHALHPNRVSNLKREDYHNDVDYHQDVLGAIFQFNDYDERDWKDIEEVVKYYDVHYAK